VDNKVVFWEVKTGKSTTSFEGHTNYVQGLAWDPRDKVGL
jgi:WD40 repeat protein